MTNADFFFWYGVSAPIILVAVMWHWMLFTERQMDRDHERESQRAAKQPAE